MIKLGETAWITTVLLLNPWPILPPPPGISPCQLLSDFSLPYEIQYQTCNLTTCATGIPSAMETGSLSPGVCWYINVISFTPTEVGLYETNISARILGGGGPLLLHTLPALHDGSLTLILRCFGRAQRQAGSMTFQ